MKIITTSCTALTSVYLSKDDTGLGNTMFQIAAAYGLSKKIFRNPMNSVAYFKY
jgi:hypothetical protein